MSDLSKLGTKILWVDTETTGTSPQSTILQLAAVANVGDQAPFYLPLIQPEDPAALDTEEAAGAMAVHGLTKERVLGYGIPAAEAWRQFKAWLEVRVNPFVKADKFLIAGYNVGFDQDQLRRWWRDPYFGSFFWNYRLDVLQRVVEHITEHNLRAAGVGGSQTYRHAIPGGPNLPGSLKLGEVAAWMGVTAPGDLHDARADILLTRNIYLELRRRDSLDRRGTA